MNSDHAPTAEEQLPPLDEGLMDFPQKDNASDVLNQVAIRQCRERQLLAALRENRELQERFNARTSEYMRKLEWLCPQLAEKDARIAELGNSNQFRVEFSMELQRKLNAAEAKLRAVSDALKEKLTERAHESIRDFHRTLYYYRPDDVDALFARIRAIVEGK